MATGDGESRARDDPSQSAGGWRLTGRDLSHSFPTNWVGRHRIQASILDNRWTITCGYGLRCTGRALSIDPRICECVVTAVLGGLRPGSVPAAQGGNWKWRGRRNIGLPGASESGPSALAGKRAEASCSGCDQRRARHVPDRAVRRCRRRVVPDQAVRKRPSGLTCAGICAQDTAGRVETEQTHWK